MSIRQNLILLGALCLFMVGCGSPRMKGEFCRGCEALATKPVGQFVIRGNEIITKIGPGRYRVEQLPGPSIFVELPEGVEIPAYPVPAELRPDAADLFERKGQEILPWIIEH